MLTEALRGSYCSVVSGICGKSQTLEQRPGAQSHSHPLPPGHLPQALFSHSALWQPDPNTTADFFTPLPSLPAFPLPLDPSLTISDGASPPLRNLGGFPFDFANQLELAFKTVILFW